MKPIISPVDKALLKAELNPDRLLRTTNRAGNELYVYAPVKKKPEATTCSHAIGS